MVKNQKFAEKAPKTSSDPQTDIQYVAAESQQGQTCEDKEQIVIETAKSLARELGTSTYHIVKKKVVEGAKKAHKLNEANQSFTAEKVDEMLMSFMQVKTEQETSEAFHSRGNVSNKTSSSTIDLDPPSPTDNVPLSKVFLNLNKALPPSPSTKTSTKTKKSFKPDDMYKSLESDPLYVKPLNIEHADEDFVVYQPYHSIDSRVESLANFRKDYVSVISKASNTSSNPT